MTYFKYTFIFPEVKYPFNPNLNVLNKMNQPTKKQTQISKYKMQLALQETNQYTYSIMVSETQIIQLLTA